jgi:hypothetical protein
MSDQRPRSVLAVIRQLIEVIPKNENEVSKDISKVPIYKRLNDEASIIKLEKEIPVCITLLE